MVEIYSGFRRFDATVLLACPIEGFAARIIESDTVNYHKSRFDSLIEVGLWISPMVISACCPTSRRLALVVPSSLDFLSCSSILGTAEF